MHQNQCTSVYFQNTAEEQHKKPIPHMIYQHICQLSQKGLDCSLDI